MLKFIKKRDGKVARFDASKIKGAIGKAVKSAHESSDAVDIISDKAIKTIEELHINNGIPTIPEIEEVIMQAARETGYNAVANQYRGYRDERTETRRIFGIMNEEERRTTTDAALMITSESKEVIGLWNRDKIVMQIEDDYGISKDLAAEIAKRTENFVVRLYRDHGVKRLRTTDIRNINDLFVLQEGLEIPRKKTILGMPASDLEALLISRSLENSNIAAPNPEALNLEIAERIQKQFALDNIFSPDVSEAHLKGAVHLHDLGYPARVYCSSHSLEYLKKYGLGDLLSNLEAKSSPPNSAAVLNQHVQTFLASLQAHYAGALGFGFLNILYAPLLKRPVDVVKGNLNGREYSFEERDLEKLIEQGVFSLEKGAENYFQVIEKRKELKELPEKERLQVAQNLIFAASQNAFSRGGQTLFIDFNVHAGVPSYLKNVPAMGPGGRYMVQMPDNSIEMVHEVPRYINKENPSDPGNGDAYSQGLEGKLKDGKILTYGDFTEPAQKFAYALLDVWRKGDKYGRPFHFPKCDLHVDETTFNDPEQEKLLNFASEIAAENGSVYFMFDRGDGAVLAQCCRLKERVSDPTMLKYPEKLRFCGFQNVTVNLAQAAYKGKNLEGTLKEIDKAMYIALNAHLQKKEFMQKLLDTDGSPMRSLGKPSDDGAPYINLAKSTYIIGNIALNEAVQVLTGNQLHESEEAYHTGLKIIAHMYKKTQEFKEKTGLKFSIEETPAESATRRFAKIDLQSFPQAKAIVKGTQENPYYTNSIHFAPNAQVSLGDRITGQSAFHDMIESGAIIHAWVGEQRPSPETIKHIVKKTLYDTRCAQLVFSPTYTECDSCGAVVPGKKHICTNHGCKNHTLEGLSMNAKKLHFVTRIVGYYSRLDHWNGSQLQIDKDREKAEPQYAGAQGIDMGWLYNPNGHEKLTIIEFGKTGCIPCKNVKESTERLVRQLGIEDKIDFKVHYLDEPSEDSLALAARYHIPSDTTPTIVIAGKGNFWKKTNNYASNGRSDLIRPSEIEAEVRKRLPEYGLEPKK